MHEANEELQQEAESKEAEKLRVWEELGSKLMKAVDLTIDIADKGKISELECHVESLELSVDEFKTCEASLKANARRDHVIA